MFTTKEQESDFIDWLTNYLYNNTDARNEMAWIPRKTKKVCRGLAETFNSFYGWATKKAETDE